jgi:predicted GNAT family acetyltransferase
MPADIRHEPDARRFVIDRDGLTALIQYRHLDDGRTLDLHHTYTPPVLRGGGVASRLTEHALRHAREHGLKIVPTCPFVAAFIKRHPEYRDLVV